jgi:hypothetical protein
MRRIVRDARTVKVADGVTLPPVALPFPTSQIPRIQVGAAAG